MNRYTGKQGKERGSGEEGRGDWGSDSGTQRGSRGGGETRREVRPGERSSQKTLCLERQWEKVRRGWEELVQGRSHGLVLLGQGGEWAWGALGKPGQTLERTGKLELKKEWVAES